MKTPLEKAIDKILKDNHIDNPLLTYEIMQAIKEHYDITIKVVGKLLEGDV